MSTPRPGTLRRQVFDALHEARCEPGCRPTCRRAPSAREVDAAITSVRAATVNTELTKNRRERRRRYTETREFGAMTVRMIRAFGKRCESADMEDLRLLVQMRDVVDETIGSTIGHLKAEQEFSWAAIAEATGTTRQGAQQRWGRRKR